MALHPRDFTKPGLKFLLNKPSRSSPMSPESSEMDLPSKNQEEVTQDDIDKRLEGLKLDDKWYDDSRIYKRLNQTEPPSKAETTRCST
jgi:hypothetical protein